MTAEVKVSELRKHQTIRGVVVSDKMAKTRVIEIKHTKKHGLYHKNLIRKTRVFIHDEKNESKVGDVVLATSCRPLSKHKNFELSKVVEVAQ